MPSLVTHWDTWVEGGPSGSSAYTRGPQASVRWFGGGGFQSDARGGSFSLILVGGLWGIHFCFWAGSLQGGVIFRREPRLLPPTDAL